MRITTHTHTHTKKKIKAASAREREARERVTTQSGANEQADTYIKKRNTPQNCALEREHRHTCLVCTAIKNQKSNRLPLSNPMRMKKKKAESDRGKETNKQNHGHQPSSTWRRQRAHYAGPYHSQYHSQAQQAVLVSVGCVCVCV